MKLQKIILDTAKWNKTKLNEIKSEYNKKIEKNWLNLKQLNTR